MTDQETHWIDDLARRSPTALAMALERAIDTGDRALEREVLVALGKLGIILVDRTSLSCSIAAARSRVARLGGEP